MIENVDYKEFSIAHAKDGAPVMIFPNGEKARIICFDRKGATSLIALTDWGNGSESSLHVLDDGIINISKRLVMSPLFKLDGKNVFCGDELEKFTETGWVKLKVELKGVPDFIDDRYLRWPVISKVLLEGKEITAQSTLWYYNQETWDKVRANHHVSNLHPYRITHLDYIKGQRSEGVSIDRLYSWEKPVTLEGRRVTPSSVLWYNNNPSRHPRNWIQVVAENLPLHGCLPHLANIPYNRDHYKWSKPEIRSTIQVYQAILRNSYGDEYLDGLQYTSADACINCTKADKTHDFVRVIPTVLKEVT